MPPLPCLTGALVRLEVCIPGEWQPQLQQQGAHACARTRSHTQFMLLAEMYDHIDGSRYDEGDDSRSDRYTQHAAASA